MIRIKKVSRGYIVYGATKDAAKVIHKTRREATLAANVLAHMRLESGAPFATIKLTELEHATILAALRFWQSKIGPDGLPAQANAASDFGMFFNSDSKTWHMSATHIDALCERINS